MENSARLRFIPVGFSTTSSTVLRIWWLNWPIRKILQKFQVHSNNDERHEHSHGLLQRLEQSGPMLKDICFVRRQLKDINKFLRICLNKMNGSKWRHYRFVKRIKKIVVQDTVDSFETRGDKFCFCCKFSVIDLILEKGNLYLFLSVHQNFIAK